MAEKILIRSPNWIGDQIMAQDFYRAVRVAYPDARVSVLASPAVAGLELPGLWDEMLVLGDLERKVPGGVKEAARRLESAGFTLAFSLPASFSSAFLLWKAGIPERVGFSGDWNRALFTRSLRWPGRRAGRHKAELFPELLRLLGHVPAPAVREPRNPADSGPFVVVAPGASLPLREWPYYSELLDALARHFPQWTVRVVGAASETKWKSLVARKASARIEDWVGRTTLSELVALCGGARLVIANDSGVAHLAATLAGAPTLVLFGPGDPVYVRPQGARVAICRVEGLPCSPCERSFCAAPYGYQRCLRDLSTDEVVRAALSLVSL